MKLDILGSYEKDFDTPLALSRVFQFFLENQVCGVNWWRFCNKTVNQLYG